MRRLTLPIIVWLLLLSVAHAQGTLMLQYSASTNDARGIGWWKSGWHVMPGIVDRHAAAKADEGFPVGAVQIMKPWGRNQEGPNYPFLTREGLEAEAKVDPMLAPIADYDAFVKAMTEISAKYRLQIYLGSPEQIPTEGRTDGEVLLTALNELAPILRIRPAPEIAFDHTRDRLKTEDRWGGPEGLLAKLFKILGLLEIQVVCESSVNKEGWGERLGTYTTDDAFAHSASGTPTVDEPDWGPRFLPIPPNSGTPQYLQLMGKWRTDHPVGNRALVRGLLAEGWNVVVSPSNPKL